MSTSAPVIRTQAEMTELADQIRAAGSFALDFEFLWERTYRPIPCLAQIAIEGDVWIIDPIQGAPLDEISALVADPAVLTIMHAPSADLMLLAMHFGTRPANLVDVQLIAGFVGIGAGQSLGTLLDRVLRIRLAKTESFSDWSKRPLTKAQLGYGREDVLHLFDLYRELTARADRMGRGGWVAEERERRYGPDVKILSDPLDAWRKVKGQGRLNGRERAVLQHLAAWREDEAARRDRPTGWLMQDRALVDLARRRPKDVRALEATRVGERMRPHELERLLQVVQGAESAPEVTLPPAPPPEVADRVEVLGSLGQLIVSTRAAASQLASQLVATRGEIESFMTDVVLSRPPSGQLSTGWRRELAGDALIALAEGRLALRPTTAPPYVEEVPV